MTQPGQTARRVAARLLPTTAMTRLVDPVIADWQKDCHDAASAGRPWRCGLAYLRGWLTLVAALAVYAARQASVPPRRWPVDDRTVLRRMLAVGAGVTALVMVLLVYGPYRRLAWEAALTPALREVRLNLLTFLLPQAVPIALPVGLIFGLLFAARGVRLSGRAIGVAGVAALVTSAASLVFVAEVVPEANQMFRTTIVRVANPHATNELARGVAELRFSDLRVNVTRAIAQGRTDEATRLAYNYNFRCALALAPVPFALFAVTVGRRRRFGAPLLALLGIWVSLAYYGLMQTASVLWQYGPTLAWLPHAGVLLLALLIGAWPARRAAPTAAA